jgi:hypothetical protein
MPQQIENYLARLNEWEGCTADKLGELFTQENLQLVRVILPVLSGTKMLPKAVSTQMFIATILELLDLRRFWAEKMKDTLVTANELMDSENPEKAMNTIKGFITFCPSPYYKMVAEEHLVDLVVRMSE